MFLLGHSCWSYLVSKLTGRRLQVNLPAWLAFLSGILPDFDIYFRPVLAHHTWTHSVLILLPISLILAIRFGRLGIAFSTGILSHLLTDSLVGTIPILYPFSATTVGLNLGIPSVSDTILETGALLAVLILAYINEDYLQITRPNKKSLWLIVPLYALITLSVLFAGDNGISLANFAFSRKAFTLITIGHAILAGLLALGVVQGTRAVISDMRHPNSPSTTSQIPTTPKP